MPRTQVGNLPVEGDLGGKLRLSLRDSLFMVQHAKRSRLESRILRKARLRLVDLPPASVMLGAGKHAASCKTTPQNGPRERGHNVVMKAIEELKGWRGGVIQK